MRTICLDFGNTRLKAAIFEDGNILHTQVLQNDGAEDLRMLLNMYHPQHSILSSVIHHAPIIEDTLKRHTRFHLLAPQSKLNFTLAVGKPDTMGADRLALAAAAVHFFPHTHNLVIGLGSCITYNFINKFHSFLGGSISPGMEMRFRSMHEHTALLPLVEKEWEFPLIGYDTKTNILSGVIMGMAKEIEGIVQAYEQRYGNFNVVLTGGDCTYFAGLLKNRIFADPEFLFKGLYAISETNN
jgi:type III pantothenate kinase